jgi:hypothetical protein
VGGDRDRHDATATTGLFYAATYGRDGDTILSGDEFEGHARRPQPQTEDGILVRSRHVAAVLWLTYDGPAALLPRAAAPTLSAEAIALVHDAFAIKCSSTARRCHAEAIALVHDAFAIKCSSRGEALPRLCHSLRGGAVGRSPISV